VRYTSHGHGETPEDQTPYALAYLGNDSKQMGISDIISMVFGAHNIYYTPGISDVISMVFGAHNIYYTPVWYKWHYF
jgi:hypothetical protein